jgi:ferrous iron transport protein B
VSGMIAERTRQDADRDVKEERTVTIAVAGNPNSGKSTLINGIAGTKLQVGNWPGVTVEKKSAIVEYGGIRVRLVDLPGTYSLSPYSEEEIIARDYLVKEKPDVIIAVVDATNLERNLYLTVQLAELGIPMVVALNIYDEAEKKGHKIDVKGMEKMLGVSVIPTVATKKTGLQALMESALNAAAVPLAHRPKYLDYGEDIEAAVKALEAQIAGTSLAGAFPSRWLSLKIMEGDERVLGEIEWYGENTSAKKAVNHLKSAHTSDIESLMADARYAKAAGLAREVLKKTGTEKMELTERIDRIVLNRFMGIPIFLIAMWFMFKLTFDLSKPFAD